MKNPLNRDLWEQNRSLKAACKPGSIELEKHVVNTWTEAIFGVKFK